MKIKIHRISAQAALPEYAHGPAEAARYARWRALGAIGKADHVMGLCARAGLAPASTLEVGYDDNKIVGIKPPLHLISGGETGAKVLISGPIPGVDTRHRSRWARPASSDRGS